MGRVIDAVIEESQALAKKSVELGKSGLDHAKIGSQIIKHKTQMELGEYEISQLYKALGEKVYRAKGVINPDDIFVLMEKIRFYEAEIAKSQKKIDDLKAK